MLTNLGLIRPVVVHDPQKVNFISVKTQSIRTAIAIFFFFSAAALQAQQRIGDFIAYSKETGLTQSSYHDVFESSDGYWWIGSNNGLFRFDGKRFKQIMYSYNDHNSPSDNNIVDIEEDGNGNLWLAGFANGITKYNLKTGRFKQYPRLDAADNHNSPMRCITKESDGTLWFGTEGKMARYIPEKDTFQLYYPNVPGSDKTMSFKANVITGIVEDNQNKDLLWIASFNGLYQFNKQTGSFIHFDVERSGLNKWLGYFLCMEQAGDELLMGTWYGGLVIFNKKSGLFRRVAYNNRGRDNEYHYLVLDLQVADSTGVYMAASYDGLLFYNTKAGSVEPVIIQKDVTHIDKNINIQNVSATPHAGFFAGGNSAIYQLQPSPNQFSRLTSYSGFSKVVVKNGVPPMLTALSFDNTRKGFWAAFYNHNRVVFYKQGSLAPSYYTAVEKNAWVNDIHADEGGRVWSVSSGGRLCILDEASGRMKYAESLISNGSLLQDKHLKETEPDGKGNFWLAGRNDIFFFDVSTNKLTAFELPMEEIKKNFSKGIAYFTLCADGKGNAWMSTSAGLLYFDRQTGKTAYYYKTLGPGKPLAAGAYKCMMVDKNDNLWLGYFNEGIQVVDTKNMNVVQSFGMKNGLPSTEINYMACDDNNNVFACLHSGLAVYNRKLKTWQTITTLDGLQKDYLDAPVFAMPGNNILLRQHESFVTFNSDSLWVRRDSSFTHISSLIINGKPYDAGLLPDYINKITLPPSTKDIHIEFSATNWRFPFRTRYFYRIDGVHKGEEWIEVKEASANLVAPASGHYKFRFYAITSDGVVTPQRVLQITIKPPYYKTGWFITLFILAVSAILYSLYKYRINQLKKMQAIRNNISRDLHDDIGASLSNINILNELARRNATDPVKSKEYLDKSGEDIQRISESLSDIVWNINPRYDDIENLFIRMKRYAADMMDGKKISYRMEFPETTEKISLSMEKRRDMFLLFKEAVNNLVKYSGAKNALVKVGLEGQSVSMLVKDDGKGFDRGSVVSGNGLYNMEQRAAAMGGMFSIQSSPGKGTEVRLVIKTS